MSERDAFPRRSFAVLPPEPGGFEAALARGKQRRRRTAGTSALASALVLALGFALNAPHPDGAARLEFTKPPISDLTGEVDAPVLVDGTDDETPELDAPAQPDDRSTAIDRRERVEPEEAGQLGAASPGDRPVRRPPPRSGRKLEDPKKSPMGQGYPTCAVNYGVDDWCLRVTRQEEPETEDATYPSTVSLDVCLSVNVPSAQLHYPTSKLVDFVVTKEGDDEELWRWSHGGVASPQPVVDTIARGNCLTYSLRWHDRTDNNGQLIVAPGTYRLTAETFARELSGMPSPYTAFTISPEPTR